MTETFLANEWTRPPKPLIDAFCEQVKMIYAKIDNSIAEITSFTRQRDELLPLLMNGQVEVGE